MTKDMVSQAISSSEKVGVAVASAAGDMVPPGGLDGHSDQSISELASQSSRSTAALAALAVEQGIDTATRAVEHGLDKALPIVQSAEDLTAQYVLPIGEKIAGNKTLNNAIERAAESIECGFQRVQAPVSKLEGLVVEYLAAPLDKRLGRFSSWADRQTPSSLASAASGWARNAANGATSYLSETRVYQGLRSRWAGADPQIAPPVANAEEPSTSVAVPTPVDAESLAEKPQEVLAPLQDVSGEL